jgi:hypothetical protein
MNQTKERELTLVEQIHEDFYSADERILQEAEDILKRLAVNPEKADRLRALGFESAKPVTDKINEAVERLHAKDTLIAIKRYRRRYPLNKFITEAEVQKLCEKWNLVLGDASNYIGDIPEKNLAEMENFTVDKSDLAADLSMNADLSGGIAEMMRAFVMHPSLFRDSQPEVSFDYNSSPFNRDSFGGSPSIEFKLHGRGAGRVIEQAREMESKRRNTSFKIVAPISDFNTTNYALAEGYKLAKKIEDPVVLQPVRGGYLIVTAWGPEASDSMVVNEINN